MKFYISTILFLSALTMQGQNRSDTTIPKRMLDSLITAHNNLKGAYKKQGYFYRLQMADVKIDTTDYGQDSTTVMCFWAKGKKLLKRKIQYKSKGCVRRETEQIYNDRELLEYAETWQLSCGVPQNTDPDIKVFSGLQTELERFEYDSLGRVTLRVWWYYTLGGARHYYYSYNDKKVQTVKFANLGQNEFWK